LQSISNLIDNIIDENSIRKGLPPPSSYKTLFLSFNYTNTENYYFETLREVFNDEVKCIHIHGEINNPDNPIIFGYDDENDDILKDIKNNPENQWLENIKSNKYSKSFNYKNLLSFINNNEYNVYILGHSCGISDRTILSKIFNNKNCLSIKIFYHKKESNFNDFDEKIMNITRMFQSDALMNEIIVPESVSEPLLNISRLLSVDNRIKPS